MVILSPETEARLQMIASRHGLSPEQMLAEVLADYEAAVAADQASSAADGELSPTMALFHRWAAEDATDDPDQIARRQREGDETQARLAVSRFNLEGRTDLERLDDDGAARAVIP